MPYTAILYHAEPCAWPEGGDCSCALVDANSLEAKRYRLLMRFAEGVTTDSLERLPPLSKLILDYLEQK